jgi:hypothetical protein
MSGKQKKHQFIADAFFGRALSKKLAPNLRTTEAMEAYPDCPFDDTQE